MNRFIQFVFFKNVLQCRDSSYREYDFQLNLNWFVKCGKFLIRMKNHCLKNPHQLFIGVLCPQTGLSYSFNLFFLACGDVFFFSDIDFFIYILVIRLVFFFTITKMYWIIFSCLLRINLGLFNCFGMSFVIVYVSILFSTMGTKLKVEVND